MSKNSLKKKILFMHLKIATFGFRLEKLAPKLYHANLNKSAYIYFT